MPEVVLIVLAPRNANVWTFPFCPFIARTTWSENSDWLLTSRFSVSFVTRDEFKTFLQVVLVELVVWIKFFQKTTEWPDEMSAPVPLSPCHTLFSQNGSEDLRAFLTLPLSSLAPTRGFSVHTLRRFGRERITKFGEQNEISTRGWKKERWCSGFVPRYGGACNGDGTKENRCARYNGERNKTLQDKVYPNVPGANYITAASLPQATPIFFFILPWL